MSICMELSLESTISRGAPDLRSQYSMDLAESHTALILKIAIYAIYRVVFNILGQTHGALGLTCRFDFC